MHWKDWLEEMLREFQERASAEFEQPLLGVLHDVSNAAYELTRLDEFLGGVGTLEQAIDRFHHHLAEQADGLTPPVREAIHDLLREAERLVEQLAEIVTRIQRHSARKFVRVREKLEEVGRPDIVEVYDLFMAGGVPAVRSGLAAGEDDAVGRVVELCRIIADLSGE